MRDGAVTAGVVAGGIALGATFAAWQAYGAGIFLTFAELGLAWCT